MIKEATATIKIIIAITKIIFSVNITKTIPAIRKYLEIREFYGTLDPEKNYLDHTIYLMGFYIESDVTRKSEMIPFGFLHLEIIKLFKKPAVNFILIYAGNLNRLFIYDRPPNSMDFAIER